MFGVEQSVDENAVGGKTAFRHGKFAIEIREFDRLRFAACRNGHVRFVTVEFDGVTENDLPTRARFLAIRHSEAQAWRARLLEADIVTDVRDDIIRFGFGLYQDEDDVERLIAGCARVLPA